MAHKTLVGGTAYNISGGKSMVSGTVYDVVGGRTMVSGTGYNIHFGSAVLDPTVAMLYSDGDLVFQQSANVINGKTLVNSYTDFARKEFTFGAAVPWWPNNQYVNIKNVYCAEEITPIHIAFWFFHCTNLTNMNFTNLNMNQTINMQYAYQNCHNFVGPPICSNSIKNMRSAYTNCYNLTGAPVCGENVTDMMHTYMNCYNLTGSPVCGNNVGSMLNTYRGCSNLTGAPVCGDNVTSMMNTYMNCYNLTGSPVCGKNVTHMVNTYANCQNLTGSPVCGARVANMSMAYYNCQNLTGSPVCGAGVANMSMAYYNCQNLTGSPMCGNNVTDMSGAYYLCHNLARNCYFYSSVISNIVSCFGEKKASDKLNVYIPAASTSLNTILSSSSNSIVGPILTWTNDSLNNRYYNTQFSIYIYPVENVAAVRLANGD